MSKALIDAAIAWADANCTGSFTDQAAASRTLHREVNAFRKSGVGAEMTDEQIKYMVNRFLGWKLPEHFSPDGGISFKRTFNDHMPQPQKNEPVGTNLLSADQATEMVRYMLDGMP